MVGLTFFAIGIVALPTMLLMGRDLRVSILRREQFETSLHVDRLNKRRLRPLLLVQTFCFGYVFALSISAPLITFPVQRALNPFVIQRMLQDPCARVSDAYLEAHCEQSLTAQQPQLTCLDGGFGAFNSTTPRATPRASSRASSRAPTRASCSV